MADDSPRNPDGTFGKGAGWTSEEARAAAQKSHAPGVRRLSQGEKEQQVDALLTEAGVDPENAPATLRVLAMNAIKGSSADMKLFLSQTGQLQNPTEKYDGKGPCPTCGQTPGEGLSIRHSQVESVKHGLQVLEELVSQSEAMVLREHGIDLHPVPFKPEQS